MKGPTPEQHDGTSLRIGIVHARWNAEIIDPLLEGVKAKLLACGVKEGNIVVESVPGSWELPIGVQRLFAASQIQSSTSSTSSAGDLLGGSTTDLTSLPAKSQTSTAAFDALIAIGVLIKGETMHFEYIADSVSHGLMRVQLDTGVPVVFGVLTVLDEAQAKARAGVTSGSHNHGEDWGLAAVEMGQKRKGWASGKVASS
ncbi:Lumazine synthase [Cryphonectria parasitica EP155]|uniref:6,7-dimethyl-8-ribityllumazine synthase n=1 Tax=Cryphonectria parasitica (strain ATCC 38755 / EP155) TaxID=660469 RepID=A0A9P4XVZ9_CRYP1|nr:Lumazine synthase [Cryphonectria parasitica EP155]KAF3762309.1 Lumazine synthase [Cryphonectria parasitica EP155]